MPLNIDWQQILLHWMNLAILTGGLYVLLYKPVKQFMAKREEHYRQMEGEAADKLAQAEQVRAGEEIRQARAKAQQALQQSTEEQLAQAQEQARQIVAHARAEAEHSRERIMSESRRELKELTARAAKKLAAHPEADPFDQFLDLAEGGRAHEEQ